MRTFDNRLSLLPLLALASLLAGCGGDDVMPPSDRPLVVEDAGMPDVSMLVPDRPLPLEDRSLPPEDRVMPPMDTAPMPSPDLPPGMMMEDPDEALVNVICNDRAIWRIEGDTEDLSIGCRNDDRIVFRYMGGDALVRAGYPRSITTCSRSTCYMACNMPMMPCCELTFVDSDLGPRTVLSGRCRQPGSTEFRPHTPRVLCVRHCQLPRS